jgi:2,3-bisphosphoglycerate-independent phosphoglycerate mutase
VLARLEQALADHSVNFYVVNFANSDMVGHTGNFDAAVKAIEVLDECVGQLMKKCVAESVTMLVTADHGNSDQMVYDNGDMHTSHTEAPVPFAVFDPKLKDIKLELNAGHFGLKDVAPTVLNIMGLPKAPNFESESIFK